MTKTKWALVVVLLLLMSTVILTDVIFKVGVSGWLISYTTLHACFIGTPLMIQHYFTGLFKNKEEPMW